MQYFTSRGYAVLRVNHRGKLGFGRKYLISGIENSLTLATSDIADATRWAQKLNLIEKDEMFLFGIETGGYYALMASLRYPDLFNATVSVSSPMNIKAELKDTKRFKLHKSYEFWKLAIHGQGNQSQALKQLSPFHRIDEYRTPMLLFYGVDNTYLSRKQSITLEKTANGNTLSVETKFIKNEGDTIKKNMNKIYIAKTTLEFFDDLLN